MCDERRTGGSRLRPAVGALVLRDDGKLLIGLRNDSDDPHWQLPQGGVHEGEAPEEAIIRELGEEIGTTRVRVVARLPNRTHYVWRGNRPDASYDGQQHVWFVVRIVGEIEETSPSEEFSRFRWIDPVDLLDETHPVRRATYREVDAMLAAWLAEGSGE